MSRKSQQKNINILKKSMIRKLSSPSSRNGKEKSEDLECHLSNDLSIGTSNTTTTGSNNNYNANSSDEDNDIAVGNRSGNINLLDPSNVPMDHIADESMPPRETDKG